MITGEALWAIALNHAPVLAPIGAQTVNEGQLLSFTVSASDPDGDILTYSATGLPAGATFDPATKTFNWTAGYDQAGSYSVVFSVSDGSLIDSEQVTITVTNVTATAQIQTLMIGIQNLNLPKGTESSLNTKLDAAKKSLEKGNLKSAVNQLGAFIHEVKAQKGKKLTLAQADYLIAQAEAIIAMIGK